MPDMETLVTEIRRSLSAMPRKEARSFHEVRRGWSKRLKDYPGASIVTLAKRLVPMGFWERILAYEILTCHDGALEALTERDVAVLGRGMASWGEVDCFACYVAGPAWRQRRISNRVIQSWACSSNHWWRRAALVSTVPLNCRARGGEGDAVRTLRVCRQLMGDRNDMVVKALSWALRELSKRDRRAVKLFLDRYAGDLAGRVRREVTNKLQTGLKNPRRAPAG
jgi:3-methyladenine DNA glycosylase AlkD